MHRVLFHFFFFWCWGFKNGMPFDSRGTHDLVGEIDKLMILSKEVMPQCAKSKEVSYFRCANRTGTELHRALRSICTEKLTFEYSVDERKRVCQLPQFWAGIADRGRNIQRYWGRKVNKKEVEHPQTKNQTRLHLSCFCVRQTSVKNTCVWRGGSLFFLLFFTMRSLLLCPTTQITMLMVWTEFFIIQVYGS